MIRVSIFKNFFSPEILSSFPGSEGGSEGRPEGGSEGCAFGSAEGRLRGGWCVRLGDTRFQFSKKNFFPEIISSFPPDMGFQNFPAWGVAVIALSAVVGVSLHTVFFFLASQYSQKCQPLVSRPKDIAVWLVEVRHVEVRHVAGRLVAGRLVAGRLVAGRLVAGRLVAVQDDAFEY